MRTWQQHHSGRKLRPKPRLTGAHSLRWPRWKPLVILFFGKSLAMPLHRTRFLVNSSTLRVLRTRIRSFRCMVGCTWRQLSRKNRSFNCGVTKRLTLLRLQLNFAIGALKQLISIWAARMGRSSKIMVAAIWFAIRSGLKTWLRLQRRRDWPLVRRRA